LVFLLFLLLLYLFFLLFYVSYLFLATIPSSSRVSSSSLRVPEQLS
jgi:hypothetical protein